MIILDTNVLTEVMRGDRGDSRVITWLRGRQESLVSTVINRAEVLSGIALLPDGARKIRMAAGADHAFLGMATILPFTDECAPAFAAILARRRAAGRPADPMDALIAAIAQTNNAGVATRNLSDFEGLGLRLLDPWSG